MEEVERACAVMRRQAKILDQLKFVSAHERSEVLASLAGVGVALDKAHAAADKAFLSIRSVYEFEQKMGSEETEGGQPQTMSVMFTIMFKAQQRITQSFVRLDSALKRAQKRLPLDLMDSWKSAHRQRRYAARSNKANKANKATACAIASAAAGGGSSTEAECAEEEEEEICMICLVQVEEGAEGEGCKEKEEEDTLLTLPCGHCFHQECVRSWLHSHRSLLACCCWKHLCLLPSYQRTSTLLRKALTLCVLHANSTCPNCRHQLEHSADAKGKQTGETEGDKGQDSADNAPTPSPNDASSVVAPALVKGDT
jgi:hypothetical protein